MPYRLTGRTTLAASSGAMVDWLNGDWGIFFVITAVMVIPSLICLWFIRHKRQDTYCHADVSKLSKLNRTLLIL